VACALCRRCLNTFFCNFSLIYGNGTQIFTTCVADFVAEIEYNARVAVPTQPGSVTLRSVFGWITIFQRVDDALDWNRTWAQYKAGFGSIDDNFWLGLENGHRHMAR